VEVTLPPGLPSAGSTASAKLVPGGLHTVSEIGALVRVMNPGMALPPVVVMAPCTVQVMGASLTLQAAR